MCDSLAENIDKQIPYKLVTCVYVTQTFSNKTHYCQNCW